jgi:hypothetical protein
MFPITLLLSLVVNVSAFVIGIVGGLLNIVSFLLFGGALIMFGFALFGSGDYYWQPAIVIAIVSFIISPYGLPKLAAWLVCKLDSLNNLIKEI